MVSIKHVSAPAALSGAAAAQVPNWRDELDWRPKLALHTEALCLLVSLSLSAWLVTAAPFLHHASVLKQSLSFVAALASSLVLLRGWCRERMYKAHQRSGPELGDPDSRFPNLDGLLVHEKAATAAAASRRSFSPAHDTAAAAAVAARVLPAVHCFHGFGSNLQSWCRIQQQLAGRIGGLVTAHDMPGFGLTQRPAKLSQYLLQYNGRLGRLVQDHELQRLGAVPPAPPPVVIDTARATGGEIGNGALGADGGAAAAAAAAGAGSMRRVLCGHSVGAICAALEALKGPQDIAGLVLVAPAIFARPGPKFSGNALEQRDAPPPPPTSAAPPPLNGYYAATSASSTAKAAAAAATISEEFVCVGDPAMSSARAAAKLNEVGVRDPLSSSAAAAAAPTAAATAAAIGSGRRPFNLGSLAVLVTALAQSALMFAALSVLRLLRPAVFLLLRKLVRSRDFWVNGLGRAYYRKEKLTDDIVDAYRLPQLVRGWEDGMFKFLISRLGHMGGLVSVWTSSMQRAFRSEQTVGDEDLAERLAELVIARPELRVLILHGVHDALVPAINSTRLARMLPGAQLVLYKECGHMPQEELPEATTERIARFVDDLEQ